MKTLMLGNEAAARGLYEARMQLCLQLSRHTQHGDHGMRSQISGNLRRMGANEKVAMEAAFGASLAGYRSFCGMSTSA